MKTVLVILSMIVFSQSAIAETGANQEALRATLGSKELEQALSGIEGLELTTASVEQSEPNQFNIELAYEAAQGQCAVAVSVKRSQMEIVAPGGGGFKIKVIWNIAAELVKCLPKTRSAS